VHDRREGAHAGEGLAAQAGDNYGAGVTDLEGVARGLVGGERSFEVVEHGSGLGVDVEIVDRNPGDRGFVPQPKRWRVEQTYGILILHRRLVRDY
jgi:hypothetical protein